MTLTMKDRQSVTKALSGQYRRARKSEKGKILDQFIKATGYNRVYAANLLRHHGKRVEVSAGIVVEGSVRVRMCKRKRELMYGADVVSVLKKVWKIMDYICGKRLVTVLPEIVEKLVRCGELQVSRGVREKLARISASSIDRLLKPERLKMQVKGRSGTKPGTLLKHQIPVRTYADWNEQQPGFLEIDLVGHDGGSAQGEYCQILDATDIHTGWSEQIAVPNKAQKWVFEAIQEIRSRMPFCMLGLDSDNGSEFINNHLTAYCQEQEITFTRGRVGRKNDNCYVEQKNWSIVRRFSGYERYEGSDACQCLNALYEVVREYVNFFMPSMKLREKVREGARVTKRYERAQTPYQRVLASNQISSKTKNKLRRRYAALNPAVLKREIEALQGALRHQATRPCAGTNNRLGPGANHPWRASNKKKKTG